MVLSGDGSVRGWFRQGMVLSGFGSVRGWFCQGGLGLHQKSIVNVREHLLAGVPTGFGLISSSSSPLLSSPLVINRQYPNTDSLQFLFIFVSMHDSFLIDVNYASVLHLMSWI